jgi:hypothetical protein
VNPNSVHQLWSDWTFRIYTGRIVPLKTVQYNAMRWARLGFGSVGEMKVSLETYGYKMKLRVEGVPANEPRYVETVKQQFRDTFVRNFGPLAAGRVDVRILAGETGERKPYSQMIGIPSIKVM